MTKIKKITKPQDLSIGQLYMFSEYSFRLDLDRGFCTKITQNVASFSRNSFCGDVDIAFGSLNENCFIAEYNAGIYRKFHKLLEQHKEEIRRLLNGEDVVVGEIAKEKWYKRWLRRKGK